MAGIGLHGKDNRDSTRSSTRSSTISSVVVIERTHTVTAHRKEPPANKLGMDGVSSPGVGQAGSTGVVECSR